MNYKEKIAELLLKDSLTDEEKLLLEQLSQEDFESRKLVETYKKLNEVINSSSHLSYEEISDYILYKNNLNPEDNTIIKFSSGIEDHLRNCPKCSDEFKILNEEFNEIENFVHSELPKQKDTVVASTHLPVKRQISIYRYSILSVLILGILYGVFFIISNAVKPKYFDVASIKNNTDFYTTRGRATNDFLKSLNALDEGNIQTAIDYLKMDIKNNPEDKTIFYSYYILGLTYLDNAEYDFVGLFPHYNNNYADQAVVNLKEAIRKNNSGSFRNITLDAYFYLAKAHIMNNDIHDAKEELKIVINEKGSKMNEAEKILNVLE